MADACVFHLDKKLVFTHLIEYDRCQLEWGIGRFDDERLGFDVGGRSHGWKRVVVLLNDVCRADEIHGNK